MKVINDILGLIEHPSKFSKNLLREADDIRGAMKKYVTDVKTGHLPGTEHTFE